MPIVLESECSVSEKSNATPPAPATGKPLHRIAAVRRRQGVALRTVARVQAFRDFLVAKAQRWTY